MRNPLLAACLLTVVFFLGCVLDFPGPDTGPTPITELAQDPWRRTVEGWELRTAWANTGNLLNARPWAAAIHPILVAILQVLLSLGSLLAFSAGKEC